MSHPTTPELHAMARQALEALLQQQPIALTHAASYKREPGFPLPIKKQAPGEDGRTCQDYRPLVILEYVHEVLSGSRKPADQPAAEAKA